MAPLCFAPDLQLWTSGRSEVLIFFAQTLPVILGQLDLICVQADNPLTPERLVQRYSLLYSSQWWALEAPCTAESYLQLKTDVVLRVQALILICQDPPYCAWWSPAWSCWLPSYAT